MRVESVYKCDEHYPVATAIALELTSPMATLSSREKKHLALCQDKTQPRTGAL